jgi:Spy/CpxP family protein refolding chaperone
MRKRLFQFVFAAAAPALLSAQSPRPSLAWWESPLLNESLDLTDAQTKQIRATVSDYRGKLLELRAAVDRAESGLQNAFNEDPVDPRKAGEAIDQLVTARSELTRTISQMDLKLRLVLTAQQWQDLESQQRLGRRSARRRGPKAPPPGITSTTKAAPPAPSR